MEVKGITRKELATKVDIDESSISKGLKYYTYPYANTAQKIAELLNTTVEYLVTGKSSPSNPENSEDFRIMSKYSKTIHNLDSLPAEIRSNIEEVILNYTRIVY